MTDSKALIERLRQLSGNTGKMTWVGDKPMTARDALTRAADHIEKLEADNARLRGALEPFAFLEMEKEEGLADTQYVWETIHGDRVRDWFDYDELKAARAALQETIHD